MCGIAGAVALNGMPIPELAKRLKAMSALIAHRGPDGEGVWTEPNHLAGIAHRRLAIIDLSNEAHQPMESPLGHVVAFNGEIYNYRELRSRHEGAGRRFRSHSDTETILAEYERFGAVSIEHLRGMFAIALWDPGERSMFLARDRFGIKPLYYAAVDGVLYFASEAKALLPFLRSITTDATALAEYLTFQYTIGEHTLFEGIKQLLPGHYITIRDGQVSVRKYWDAQYVPDFSRSHADFVDELRALLGDSISAHLVSDVEVGSYLSGGLDSSLLALLAAKESGHGLQGFHGRFVEFPGYDESQYAQAVARDMSGNLHIRDITALDFRDSIRDVIYHLDFPVAGPGAFAQYMVSEMAATHLKVVLGGQGGDEVFGGYVRYLVAYLEQCLRAAIDDTYRNGHFVVTLESIIPNLPVLQEYRPLMAEFWRDGLFGELDDRFFRLINRRSDMGSEFHWDALDMAGVRSSFDAIFSSPENVGHEAYFDKMTHFEFKTLLPALLTVEDRMSMAHGLESRVPILDHPLIEFAATIPADVKFKNGQLKHLLREAFIQHFPHELANRRDKMGFPVPLREWLSGPLAAFGQEIVTSLAESERPFVNGAAVAAGQLTAGRYSRKTWAMMSLELWHQAFHDRSAYYRSLIA